MKDIHGRTIDYLRVSLTDRCNLRCIYCMPEEGVCSLSHHEILRLEEIERLVRIAADLGISRIRLTGGEPLVRKGVTDLVRSIVHTPGIESVAMTTNGILLPAMADQLKGAGLARVNISLDTMDPETYRFITRRGSLADALAGIDAALQVGFDPVKLNVVVVRSLNQELLEFAKLTLDKPLHVRFIEYMPVGDSAGADGTGWGPADVIPSDELQEMISRDARTRGIGSLEPVSENKPQGWGPARYYRFAGAQGTVGFISPLSRHFCSECNRLRLTPDGKIRPCLFSDDEYDVRAVLRGGSDDDVRAVFRAVLGIKPDAHHDRVGTERGMNAIGG